jgi:hypothetical protein
MTLAASTRAARLLLAVCAGLVAVPCAAQTLTAPERETIVRMRVDRGGRAEDVAGLIRQVDAAAAQGLPAEPLASKVREGLAKGHDPARIEPVIRQMAADLGTADTLLREQGPSGAAARSAVILLAEALGSGVSPDEVRALGRLAQRPGTAPSADVLAGAARGLSFIKEARLPADDGAQVMAESVRQGYRQHEVLDLGREIRRRATAYREDRALFRTLREAIARGERTDRLFRDVRPDPVVRPASDREPAPDRPVRPQVPERPQAPERPQRPDVPERPDAGRVR